MAAGYEVPCMWAGVEFWAVSMSGSANRRWAVYTAAYREGAEQEDLGRDARTEMYQTTLDRETFQKLEKAVNAKQVRLWQHPIFGSFNARVRITQYAKTSKSRISATIEVQEYKAQDIEIVSASPDQKAAQAEARWNDLKDAVDAVENAPDGVTSAMTDADTAWSDVYNQTQSAELGNAEWQDVDRSLEQFRTKNTELTNNLREVEDQPETWNAIDLGLRASADLEDFVESTRAEPQVRRVLKLTADTDVYSLAYAIWGHGQFVDDIIDQNNILDPFFIELGTELELPPP